MKKSASEKCFDFINAVVMVFIILITLYPFYYIICASFSSSNDIMSHMGLIYTPLNFTLGGYRLTFNYPLVSSGYKNTLLILILALPINMILSLFLAYIMASKRMMFK